MAVSETPQIQTDTPRTHGSAGWSRDLVWLMVCFAVVFFVGLGSQELRNPDEGRYAEIAREMVVSGDWVTPRLNGVNYFEKPPLVYWVNAASLKAFGPSEWAMRATPALFGLAGVLLTYAAARRLHGRSAGLLSAIVLGTSLLYVILSYVLLLDMAMSVLMAATLFCFILGVREPAQNGGARRWFFYGLYASAALATLTKGLIGFLVTGAVMFLWLLLFNQWRRLRPLYLPSGVLIFLAIAAPWHVLAALRNETWVHRYFVYEHFERFLTPAAGRPGAWWYFIPVLLVGLMPWTGLLWPALRDTFASGWKRRVELSEAWYLVVWVAFIFLFFSASHSKLPPYILPVLPALAVLIGAWLAQAIEREGSVALRTGLRVHAFFCGMLAAGFAAILVRPEIAGIAGADIALLRPWVIGLIGVVAIGGVLPHFLAKFRGPWAALLVMAATMAVLFAGLRLAPLDHVLKPGTRTLALIVKEKARPGDRVLQYQGFYHDFTFYADRLVDVVDYKGELELEEDAVARASGRFIDRETFLKQWNQPGRMWVVARTRDVAVRADGQPTLFADPSFRYHLIAKSARHTLFSNQP